MVNKIRRLIRNNIVIFSLVLVFVMYQFMVIQIKNKDHIFENHIQTYTSFCSVERVDKMEVSATTLYNILETNNVTQYKIQLGFSDMLLVREIDDIKAMMEMDETYNTEQLIFVNKNRKMSLFEEKSNTVILGETERPISATFRSLYFTEGIIAQSSILQQAEEIRNLNIGVYLTEGCQILAKNLDEEEYLVTDTSVGSTETQAGYFSTYIAQNQVLFFVTMMMTFLLCIVLKIRVQSSSIAVLLLLGKKQNRIILEFCIIQLVTMILAMLVSQVFNPLDWGSAHTILLVGLYVVVPLVVIQICTTILYWRKIRTIHIISTLNAGRVGG